MIFFLTALIIPTVFAQQTCLNDGVLGPTGDKCYHFISAQQNFEEAEAVCRMFDSVLVTIRSGIESNFILDNVHQKFSGEYWIGLTDLETENIWRWMEGGPYNYTNWGSGFPKSDVTRRCVAAQWSGYWMNVNCSTYSASFVCQSQPPNESELSRCPPNAVEGPAGCFIINVVPETYKVAETVCGKFGGTLAEVVTSQQAVNLISIVKEHLYKTDFWIGVSDPYDSGVWQFVDGTPTNFTYWAVGYPENDGNSLCVASRLFDGKWHNTGCDNKKPSVCQQKLATPVNKWIYFLETDSYYKGYASGKGTFLEFEKNCTNEGAHLASIHSFRENLFVSAAVLTSPNQNVAIGVYFNPSNKTLTWMDGTPWNYEYWYNGTYKADNSYLCAYQYPLTTYGLKWYPYYCTTSTSGAFSFVCKKPRVSL